MDYKESNVVDTNGFYKARIVVLLPEDSKPYVRGYTLQDGETLVDAVAPTRKIDSGFPGFIKPRWDGSAWVEGATAEEVAAWEAEHPDPHAKTLAEVQADKLTEINAACDAAITAGCSVTLSDGTAGHISLSIPDQINLSTAQTAISSGATEYAYHLDGTLCRMFSATDILIMAQAATGHILYHQTYCNHLRAWVKRCEEISEVQAITYGAELPEDLAAHMAAVLAAAEGGNG